MGIDLHDIRYARIGTEDLDTSVRFATEILGLDPDEVGRLVAEEVLY